jgi:hypothetical protein
MKNSNKKTLKKTNKQIRSKIKSKKRSQTKILSKIKSKKRSQTKILSKIKSKRRSVKQKKCRNKKISIVMAEFKKGKLKMRNKKKVTNPKQAIAIALSEADRYC